jgi:hypothetical protein
MLKLKSKITISTKASNFQTEYYFDFVHSVDIKSSFEDLTETAHVKFPRNLSYKGTKLFIGDNAIFKRNDKIKIELGYDPDLKEVFNGYITEVGENCPIELVCQDAMYVLKKKTIKTYSKSKTTLNALLTDILEGTGIEFEPLDVSLGSFRITNATVSKILDELKKDYGLYSYFRDGKLHCGLPSDASKTNTEELAFEKNIINPEDLKYQLADEISIKVVAISMQDDNSKKQIEVGDTDGATRTYYTYNATDAALKEFADLKLNAVKYTGYVGTVKTFGEPYLRHGDIVKITGGNYTSRNGNYELTSVSRHFSVNDGYKQDLELGVFVGAAT